MRLVPIGIGLAPCEVILRQRHDLPEQLLMSAWEVGRLVLAAEYRAHPEVLRRCFFLILGCFIGQYPQANFFATCSPVLSRLYRRFGFSVLVRDALRVGPESYSLIHGTVQTVVSAVAVDDACASFPQAAGPEPRSTDQAR